jgi:hypothetical protein
MCLKRLFKTNDYSIKKPSGWGILFQYRSWIFLMYGLVLILSLWGMLQLKPTYDLFSFLPKSVESMKGISIIRSNQGYSDSLWLMLPAKPKSDTLLLKETLSNIPNVAEITWIDSLQNPAYPDPFLPDEARETFLSGDKTILEIKLTALMSNQEKGETIQRIQSMIPPSADLGGEAVIMESLRRTTNRESKYYTMLAIISIAVLLSLLLRSWKKPLLVLTSMGCTILMTMGGAYYSGTISFLTKSITPSILLGITMDYALFLIHRMEEELPRHLEKRDAIVAAVRKSFLPIAASALTTFAGLISLTAMNFGLGKDMGLLLAKGIVIAFVVNQTLLPVLLYTFSGWFHLSKKKVLIEAFSPKPFQFRRVLLSLFPLLLVIAIFSSYYGTHVPYYISNERQFKTNSSIMRSNQAISNHFQLKSTSYLIYKSVDTQSENEWIKRVENLSSIKKVISQSNVTDTPVPDFYFPLSVQKRFQAGEYRLMTILFSRSVDEKATEKDIRTIRSLNHEFFTESYLTGSAGFASDTKQVLMKDLNRVTWLSSLLIFLIILCTFRSFLYACLLILTVQLAIWINVGISCMMDQPLYQLTPIFISAIQMGATIDYGILFTTRYLEEKQRSGSRLESIYRTWTTVFPAIATSAGILFIATLGIALIASLSTASEVSQLLGRGALVSFTLIMGFYPGLLLLLDPLISKKGEKK